MKRKYLKAEYTKSLIDAARDLLEALEGVIDDLYDWCDEEGDSEYNKRVQKCKDAIIKATTIHMV